MRNPLVRRAAIAAAAFVVLLLAWQVGISPAIGRLRDMERALSRGKRDLAAMRDLQREVVALERSRPGERGESGSARGQELVSSVEECVKRSGLSAELSYRPETAEPGTGGPAAPRVAVVIRKVDLSQLISILHEIESSPRGFRVNDLRVKAGGPDGSELRAEFEVSAIL